MAIVKNGAWIAIDSVETDTVWFTGTGRPDDKLTMADPWKSTLSAWSTIGIPPTEKDDKMYAIKNGVWSEIDAKATVNLVDGNHTVVNTDEKGNLKIDVNLSPELNSSEGCLDFTK